MIYIIFISIVIPILVWVILKTRQSSREYNYQRNWSGNINFSPQRIYCPTTLKELRRDIEDAVERGLNITPAGSIHSFSASVSTDQAMIDMKGFNKFIKVDRSANLVTAEAGILLDTLYDHMVKNDVAFKTLPNVGRITLGGATIMCTHGSTLECGTFAGLVHSFKAVIYREGKTELIECFSEDNEQRDIYEAFFPSFGALGIVYELTMKTVPNYNHIQTRAMVKFETLYGNLRTVFEDCNVQWCACTFTPTEPACFCRTSIPVSPNTTAPTGKTSSDSISLLLTLFLFYSRNYSPDVGLIQKFIRFIVEYFRLTTKMSWFFKSNYFPFPVGTPNVLQWHHAELETMMIKYLKKGMRWINLEYALSIDKVDEAFKEISEFVKKNIKNGFQFCIIRSCGADECGYLNPCKGRRTLFFDLPYDSYAPKGFYLGLEKIFLRHGGRVSWSRLFFSERMEYLKNYPEFDKFLEMKKKLDPDCVFGNEWSKRIMFG